MYIYNKLAQISCFIKNKYSEKISKYADYTKKVINQSNLTNEEHNLIIINMKQQELIQELFPEFNHHVFSSEKLANETKSYFRSENSSNFFIKSGSKSKKIIESQITPKTDSKVFKLLMKDKPMEDIIYNKYIEVYQYYKLDFKENLLNKRMVFIDDLKLKYKKTFDY